MNKEEKIQAIKAWLGTGSINFFGLPFSGKDTQCKILAEKFNGVQISSGDILRQQATLEELGPTNSGDVAPSDLFFRLVLPYFSRNEFDGKPLILSTVGRSKGEEIPVMDGALKSGHPLKAIIYLVMPEETVWERYKESKIDKDRGKRADDGGPDILRTRLKTFHNNTLKVIDFYRQNGMLIEVDGTQSREEVMDEIVDKLYQITIEDAV